MSSLSWCLFCLRESTFNFNYISLADSGDKCDGDKRDKKELARFFKLFFRYTNRNRSASNHDYREVITSLLSPLEKRKCVEGSEDGGQMIPRTDFATCQDCSLVLQDFCDLYDKVTVLQMKLDWKLQTLKSVMKSAGEVPFRIQKLREVLLVRRGVNDEFEKFWKFRKKLAMTAAKKLKASVPRVELEKCDTGTFQSCTGNRLVYNIELRSCDSHFEAPSETKVVIGNIDVTITPTVINADADVKPAGSQEEGLHVEDEKVRELAPESNSNIDIHLSSPNSISIEERGDGETETGMISSHFQCETVTASESFHVQPSLEMEENIDKVNREHKQSFPDLSDNEYRSIKQLDIALSPSDSFLPSNENSASVKSMSSINQSVPSTDNDINAILDENIEEPQVLEDTDEVNQFVIDPDKADDISASEIPNPSSATHIFKEDLACASNSPEGLSQPRTPEPATRRRSQRKCVVGRKRNRGKRKISTRGGIKLENKMPRKSRLRGGVPSLKELALNQIMKWRYICKVKACRSKKKSFLNIDDFRRHSTLHQGTFRCNFCKFKTNYAPSLSTHEINLHSPKIEDNVKNMYKCPRCALDFFTVPILKVHHLKSHLKLMPDRRTCRICHLSETPNKAIGDVPLKNAMEHYSVFHDLTGVDLETVEKCDKPNCRAYFRTPRQLKRHNDWVHKGSGESERVRGGLGKTVARPVRRKRKEVVGSSPAPPIPKFDLSPHVQEQMKECKICTIKSCGAVSYSAEDFEVHSKLHGKFKCISCGVVFNYAKKLFLHEKTHLKERAFPELDDVDVSCPRCDYLAPRNARSHRNLISHFLEEHLGLKLDVLTCPVCNAKLLRNNRKAGKNILLSHMRYTHDFSATVYNCEIPGCQAYFNTNIQLITHRNNHKVISSSDSLCSGSKKKFHCSVCGKGFNLKGGLLYHQRTTHLKHLPFACPSDACLERFESQEDLARHTSANGVVVCPQCGKSYHGYSGLNLHLKFCGRRKGHPKKKNWICDVCGKDFTGEENLRLHKFSHTGPDSWEYVCDVCGKKNLTQQKLDEHKRTHSKEKPFTCEHCGVSYAHRHNLRIHINNKHSDIASDPPKKFDKSRLVSRKGVKLSKNHGVKATAENEKSRCSKGRRAGRRRRPPSFSSASNSEIDD